MIIMNISTTDNMIFQFLETSFQNVRSSKRTDALHNALLDQFLKDNPDYTSLNWRQEHRLQKDAFGGTFDIDIVGLDDDGNIKIAILAKAMNSNVNKNIKNYANTTIGEAARLYYAPNVTQHIDKIVFVSVLPRVAPRFNKNGNVVGFDDVVGAKDRTNIKQVLQTQYNGKVQAIDLLFSINDVKEGKNVTDYHNIIPSGITSFNLNVQ